ncbi:MAG: VanZ family protein [Chthoniobacterales bacterium]|nr:VanZ family protein [Chthoniobacterales bacterium]
MKILRFVLWFLFTCWLITIFYLASLPQKEIPTILSVIFMDKIAHFFAFLIGGFLFLAALHVTPPIFRIDPVFFSITFAIFIGLANEFYQIFVPTRTGADLPDIIANTFGSITGIAICQSIRKKVLPIALDQKTLPSKTSNNFSAKDNQKL